MNVPPENPDSGRQGVAGTAPGSSAEKPSHEREWQAQERAMRAERLGLDPADGDARIAEYRLLSRALRHPPLDPIPADFAAQVAAMAARPRVLDEHLETALLRGLIGLLALSGAVAAAIYGGTWLQPIAAVVPDMLSNGATNWAAAVAACVGLNWAMGQLRRHRESADA